MRDYKQIKQDEADNKADIARHEAEANALMDIAAADRSAEQAARLAEVRTKLKALDAVKVAIAEDLAMAERLKKDVVAAHVIQVGQHRAEADPKKGFRTPTEFLASVMNAGMGRQDERLNLLRATVGSDEAGGYSDPHGGFFVPEGLMLGPLQITPEDDPIGGRTRKVPMANPVVSFNARVDKNHNSSVTGGLTVTRRPETVEGTSSRTTYERVTMRANNLFGLSFATEEILTDSPVSFAAILATGFAQEFASKLIDERLNGSGNGEFEGVMNSPALITVTKETGQAADTIQFENVNKMAARCWGFRSAVWLANHDTRVALSTLYMPIGTSGERIRVFEQGSEGAPEGRLLGQPIFFTEYTKTIGDAGDIVLVNWNEYLEGLYQPMQSAESMHVRFVNHERAFKFWQRNDGRGWWRSALTPKNSAVTLSPFVTLAARA